MRLSEASKTFLEVRRQEGFSGHTIEAYRLQRRILLCDIGDLDLGQVTLQVPSRTFVSQRTFKSIKYGSQNQGD